MSANRTEQLDVPQSVAAASRPVRMLAVSSDTFPPIRVDVAILFGKELASRGHQVDWVLQSEAACDRGHTVQWGGGTVWVGPTDLGNSLLHRIRKHCLGIANDLRLIGLVKRGQYDIVEVKDKFICGVFAAIAVKLYKKRFIYWLSYPLAEDYLFRVADGSAKYPVLYRIRGTVSKFLLYKLLMPMADHVFVQSEQMRLDVAAEGVPLGKTTAVPMGINVDAFRAIGAGRPRTRIPAGELCYLYLGTLGKVRKLDFLIRVHARVLQRLPAAKLYIVGRGDHPEDEQLLSGEAARLGITASIVFVGHLPQSEALEYVRDADVCVSPFFPTPVLNSASPTKLVEYMALGKAVVANDHPEQRLVLQESGAGLCVPWQEDAFAEAIVTLLKAPEMAREMGSRGREYAIEHRSYSRIADSVERVLLSVAHERAPSLAPRGESFASSIRSSTEAARSTRSTVSSAR